MEKVFKRLSKKKGPRTPTKSCKSSAVESSSGRLDGDVTPNESSCERRVSIGALRTSRDEDHPCYTNSGIMSDFVGGIQDEKCTLNNAKGGSAEECNNYVPQCESSFSPPLTDHSLPESFGLWCKYSAFN